MSDFFNSGWSWFVAAAVVVGLLACLWLLMVASKREPMVNAAGIDDGSTGHVWDEDLREMNHPLPRWWMWLFIITVVFAAAYLALYPGLGSAKGRLGWTSEAEFESEQAAAETAMAMVYARFNGMPAETLAREPQAMAIGERLFINTCAACHGSDARGSKGFPNLTDGDWLGAGTPAYIEQTITEGRTGNMPPMAAAVGTADEVHHLANYVLSLSGSPHNSLSAQIGRSKFTACAACHGAEGKGNPVIGAPNLTDKIWLHGWGEDAIVAMVNKGKTNVMPAQGGRLSKAQIHVLAAYVWGLSNSPASSGTFTQ